LGGSRLSWFRQKRNSIAAVVGDGEFEFNIVGESHYQRVIESIVGGKTPDGAHKYCAALILPEPTNKYDKNAVVVTISQRTVGYLSRDDCKEFNMALKRAGYSYAACEALVVGGWRRRNGDEGHFGVKLNAISPFDLISPEDYWRARLKQEHLES